AGKADEKKFQDALDFVCIELAKKIAKDGEGATKLIEVSAKNAKTEEDAKKIAKSVINSNLVKCAIFGKDINWGRIMSAMGNSNAAFNENKVDIYFDDKKIVENGKGANYDVEKIKKIMDKDNLKITIDLKDGKGNAAAYGCDMSYDYIKINAEYTT
ncbi:MAG: bifunctional ornithine acetyltransferase/N-acetylglutamate synthase, partial [Nanoarchaeota archaeon]